MKLELCNEFFYRIDNESMDLMSVFNTSKDNVYRNNSKIKIFRGELVKIKVNDFVLHIVKPTETLSDIAKKYGVNLSDVLKDNHLTNEKLFIGQTIRIYKNKKPTN